MQKNSINLISLEENPLKFEELIFAQQNQYETDPQIKQLLDSIFLEKDRARAFNRFLNSIEFKTIKKILSLFGVSSKQKICEIGGGPGFLTWALSQAGFKHLDLFEPNAYYNTGTGYLRTRQDINDITFHSELNKWHASVQSYDVVITKNCIHHFQNIAMAAAYIRQKMTDNAYWFAFREWFADTPEELYSQLNNHPYCQPYNVYEWPYPASHYAEAIEIAGFRLVAVIPYDYANNCLGTWSEDEWSPAIQKFTKEIDQTLQSDPAHTVRQFWDEFIANKLQQKKSNLYLRPQMMLFQKIPVAHPKA